VAAAAAALGLMALANLTSAPPRAGADKTPSSRAPIAVPAGRDPLALARADSVNR
jgi:hypothetical protein